MNENKLITIKSEPWHASDYINDPETYLKASLEAVQETGDSRIFSKALQEVAKAKKITVINEKTELDKDTKLHFDTINKAVNAIGFKLTLQNL